MSTYSTLPSLAGREPQKHWALACSFAAYLAALLAALHGLWEDEQVGLCAQRYICRRNRCGFGPGTGTGSQVPAQQRVQPTWLDSGLWQRDELGELDL